VGNVVDVIDIATNTVEPSTIPVGSLPTGVAITPDGSFVYVANLESNTVSVISTSTNTVVGSPIPVGANPLAIAIANLSAPFAAFTIDNLVINSNLHEQGDFTLGANTGGIDLAHQPLTLTVNNFSLTIPAGSFRQVGGNMHFVFNGTVNGLAVNFNLQAENGSSTQFDYVVDVQGVNITGPNPANVGLQIGHNSGTTMAEF
jgi:YVTN family beta-propeller protein